MAVVQDGEITQTHEFFFGTKLTPDAETMMAQWEEWYPLIASRRLVAHNIATERTILRKVAPLTKWGPWVDTLQLAKARYPKLPNYALGDLCEIFGLVPQLDGRTWHDALYDAVACAKLALFLAA
jgi:DNA polymerase-3 subunit epsilon